MPVGVVQTPRDEHLWSRAKAVVRNQYPDVGEESDRFWRLVQGVYQRMRGEKALGGELEPGAEALQKALGRLGSDLEAILKAQVGTHRGAVSVKGHARITRSGKVVQVTPHEAGHALGRRGATPGDDQAAGAAQLGLWDAQIREAKRSLATDLVGAGIDGIPEGLAYARGARMTPDEYARWDWPVKFDAWTDLRSAAPWRSWDGRTVFLVHPSTREPGKVQVSRVFQDGPSGHRTYDSIEVAEKALGDEAIRTGDVELQWRIQDLASRAQLEDVFGPDAYRFQPMIPSWRGSPEDAARFRDMLAMHGITATIRHPDPMAEEPKGLKPTQTALRETLAKVPDEARRALEALADAEDAGAERPEAALTPEEDWKQNGVRAAAFKAWFGDWEKDPDGASKVVNPDGTPKPTHPVEPSQVVRDGKPVVVYHGTPQGSFRAFDPATIGDPTALDYGPGFYFTEDKAVASEYAEGRQHQAFGATSAVLAVYLSVRKPLDADVDDIDISVLPPDVLEEIVRSHPPRPGESEYIDSHLRNLQFYRRHPARYTSLHRTVGGPATHAILKRLGYDGITHMGSGERGPEHQHRVWIAFRPEQVKAVENAGTFDPSTADMYKSIGAASAELPILLRYSLLKGIVHRRGHIAHRGGKLVPVRPTDVRMPDAQLDLFGDAPAQVTTPDADHARRIGVTHRPAGAVPIAQLDVFADQPKATTPYISAPPPQPPIQPNPQAKRPSGKVVVDAETGRVEPARAIGDVGEKIGRSRKERWWESYGALSDDDYSRLEREDPEAAAELTTKEKLFGTFGIDEARTRGMSGQAAWLYRKLVNLISTGPMPATYTQRRWRHSRYLDAKTDSEIRQAYRDGLRLIHTTFMKATTLDDVLSGIDALYKFSRFEHQYHEGMPADQRALGIALSRRLKDQIESLGRVDSLLKTSKSALRRDTETAVPGNTVEEVFAPKTRETTKPPVFERQVPEQVERVGPPIEAKAPEDLMALTGIRGVQYGNYMTDEDRAIHTAHAAEAFTDLADILGIPVEQIALKGRLAIAFGARGSGRFAAHYEPGLMVINLTKASGGGTLAHEWGHFLDHVLGGGRTGGRRFYASDQTTVATTDEAGQAWADLMRTLFVADATTRTGQPVKEWAAQHDQVRFEHEGASSWRASNYAKRSAAAGEYWSRPTEMLARAFESYCEDSLRVKGRKSSYLVSGTWKTTSPVYPQDAERYRINAAFARFFAAARSSGLLEKALRNGMGGLTISDLLARALLDQLAS